MHNATVKVVFDKIAMPNFCPRYTHKSLNQHFLFDGPILFGSSKNYVPIRQKQTAFKFFSQPYQIKQCS